MPADCERKFALTILINRDLTLVHRVIGRWMSLSTWKTDTSMTYNNDSFRTFSVLLHLLSFTRNQLSTSFFVQIRLADKMLIVTWDALRAAHVIKWGPFVFLCLHKLQRFSYHWLVSVRSGKCNFVKNKTSYFIGHCSLLWPIEAHHVLTMSFTCLFALQCHLFRLFPETEVYPEYLKTYLHKNNSYCISDLFTKKFLLSIAWFRVFISIKVICTCYSFHIVVVIAFMKVFWCFVGVFSVTTCQHYLGNNGTEWSRLKI